MPGACAPQHEKPLREKPGVAVRSGCHSPQPQSPHTATKTRCNQINKEVLKHSKEREGNLKKISKCSETLETKSDGLEYV